MVGTDTTRQLIDRLLRETPMTATQLAEAVGTTPDAAVDHVRHVARSLGDEEAGVEVAPPRCRACGFVDFDDPANRPSRCPACHAEAVDDQTFTIRP